MKKKIIIILAVIIILVIILGLWISGIIPKQIAKISSSIYLKCNFPEKQLEYVDIEWSPYHGDYIIKYKDKNNELYSFGIGPKYFPISLGQGIFKLEDSYRIEYGSGITGIDDFYNHSITSKYQDLRTLPENYSKEQAQKDNCFIIGAMVHNNNLYSEFMDKYNKKEDAFIRVVQSTVEGDIFIIDVLYEAKNNKIHLVKDDTRDKFSAQEDRTIKYKTYEKTGVWNYGNSQYWVAYNGELLDGDTKEYMLNSEELFIIAIIN